MMKQIFILTCACWLFVACGNKSKATEVAPTETTAQHDMHNAANSLDYYGTYKGIFPAASCPGIETTLVLHANSTYTLLSVYIDEKDGVYDEKGTYTIDGNVISLTAEGGETQYYKVEEGQIRRLDDKKQEITGQLADNYVLKLEQPVDKK